MNLLRRHLFQVRRHYRWNEKTRSPCLKRNTAACRTHGKIRNIVRDRRLEKGNQVAVQADGRRNEVLSMKDRRRIAR